MSEQLPHRSDVDPAWIIDGRFHIEGDDGREAEGALLRLEAAAKRCRARVTIHVHDSAPVAR